MDNKVSMRFFAILLGVAGLTLLFMIGTNMVNLYRGSIDQVEPEEESRKVDCYQMTFTVGFEDANTITVENTPLSSFDLDEISLTNAETGDTIVKKQSFFVPGKSRELDISEFDAENVLCLSV
jgi:hypothetical protein